MITGLHPSKFVVQVMLIMRDNAKLPSSACLLCHHRRYYAECHYVLEADASEEIAGTACVPEMLVEDSKVTPP